MERLAGAPHSFAAPRRTRRCGAVRHCAQASSEAAPALPAALRKIVGAFQMVPDPMQRYKQLLFYASRLKPLPAELQTPENKVQGCVSQVWLAVQLRAGAVQLQADSDSQLTKGLAALLVEGLSGAAPDEILRLSPDFIEQLGLKQSLTPSRNNGFLNMLLLIQKKTLELSRTRSCEGVGAAPSGGEAEQRPLHRAIVARLTEALAPSRLDLVDESASHAGHAGVAGRSGETHFRLAVVSDAFAGLSAVARHRLVYAALDAQFQQGLHALTISAQTEVEAAKVGA